MPTLVYLVHGMGCGTSAGGTPWSTDVKQAMLCIQKAFGLAELEWMDPIPEKVPKGSEKTWVIPVSYYEAFDQFRTGAADRAAALKDLTGNALSDARIADLARAPFLWNNCLDVLLWWSGKVQARPQATVAINTALTRSDALARKISGKTRRIVMAHSLGTAATTHALRYLAGSGAWQVTGGNRPLHRARQRGALSHAGERRLLSATPFGEPPSAGADVRERAAGTRSHPVAAAMAAPCQRARGGVGAGVGDRRGHGTGGCRRNARRGGAAQREAGDHARARLRQLSPGPRSGRRSRSWPARIPRP